MFLQDILIVGGTELHGVEVFPQILKIGWACQNKVILRNFTNIALK